MARVPITPVVPVSRAGVLADDTGADGSYTTGDAANDHNLVNDGATFLHVVNNSVSSAGVYIDSGQAAEGGMARGPRVVSVGANSQVFLGPFEGFDTAQDGITGVQIVGASFKFKAFRIPIPGVKP